MAQGSRWAWGVWALVVVGCGPVAGQADPTGAASAPSTPPSSAPARSGGALGAVVAKPSATSLLQGQVLAPAGIVAGGAGNIVAGGAGNIVAGGAGNVVAGGAGNLLPGVQATGAQRRLFQAQVQAARQGQPLAKAPVRLLDDRGRLVAEGLTDEQGRYRFQAPPKQGLKVEVAARTEEGKDAKLVALVRSGDAGAELEREVNLATTSATLAMDERLQGWDLLDNGQFDRLASGYWEAFEERGLPDLDDPNTWDAYAEDISAQLPSLQALVEPFVQELAAALAAELPKIKTACEELQALQRSQGQPVQAGLCEGLDPSALGDWQSGLLQPGAGMDDAEAPAGLGEASSEDAEGDEDADLEDEGL